MKFLIATQTLISLLVHFSFASLSSRIRNILYANESVILNKCSDAVLNETIHIPLVFREPFSDEKLEKLESILGDGLFTFKLENNRPNCTQFITRLLNTNYPLTGEEYSLRVRHFLAPFSFTYYGFLQLINADFSEDRYYNLYYDPQNYCISSITADQFQVEVCIPDCTDGGTDVCVRKHCPMGMVTSMSIEKPEVLDCVEADVDEWSPFFYNALATDSKYSQEDIVPYYVHEIRECPNADAVFLGRSSHSQAPGLYFSQIKVLRNGTSFHRDSGNHPWIQDFLVDGLVDVKPNTNMSAYERTEENQVVIVCAMDFETDRRYYAKILLPFLFAGAVVYFVIVIIYGLLWKTHNVHGWTISAMSLCSFFQLMLEVVTYLKNNVYGEYYFHSESTACTIIGVLTQFLGIAQYTWMAIMSFDIWMTIRSMTPMSHRSKGKSQFTIYCFVGFLIPTICTGISWLIETQFGYFDDHVIRPLYGRYQCGVDPTAYFYHHSIPELIVFMTGNIFFILSIRILYAHNQATKNRLDKSTSNKCRSLAKVFGRILVLMAPSMIFQIIPFFILGGAKHLKFLIVFYFYNALVPFGLFWIFVCNKDIWEKLLREYPSLESISCRRKSTETKGIVATKSTNEETDVSIRESISVKVYPVEDARKLRARKIGSIGKSFNGRM